MINRKCKNKDVTVIATVLWLFDKSDSWQFLWNAVQRHCCNESLPQMTDKTLRTSGLRLEKSVLFYCKAPQFHLLFVCQMTILAPHGSLRSHNSLTNFNMSTQLTNVLPQQKNPCNVLIIMAQERCQCQYGGCTALSVMKTGAAIATDVHLAEWCTMLQKDLMLIMRVETKERPSYSKQSGQAMQEGSANGDIISRLRNLVISNWNRKRQQCAAQYGPVVKIWPNLTIHWRRKKGVESRKIIYLFWWEAFLELHG